MHADSLLVPRAGAERRSAGGARLALDASRGSDTGRAVSAGFGTADCAAPRQRQAYALHLLHRAASGPGTWPPPPTRLPAASWPCCDAPRTAMPFDHAGTTVAAGARWPIHMSPAGLAGPPCQCRPVGGALAGGAACRLPDWGRVSLVWVTPAADARPCPRLHHRRTCNLFGSRSGAAPWRPACSIAQTPGEERAGRARRAPAQSLTPASC